MVFNSLIKSILHIIVLQIRNKKYRSYKILPQVRKYLYTLMADYALGTEWGIKRNGAGKVNFKFLSTDLEGYGIVSSLIMQVMVNVIEDNYQFLTHSWRASVTALVWRRTRNTANLSDEALNHPSPLSSR